MSPFRRKLISLAVAAVVVCFATALILAQRTDTATELTLTEFLSRVESDEVATALINDRMGTITGELTDGTNYSVRFPGPYGDELTDRLVENEVQFDTTSKVPGSWLDRLSLFLPIVLITVIFIWLVMTMSGRGFGKFSKAKARYGKDIPEQTFADVAGVPEAVTELDEVVRFLKNPDQFASLGARAPRGVLLVGSPGTGKTLLARAVAGEAKVGFFSISGSDFVEMFVGVGARRVRDLFREARKNAPCIVFLDEIDAVGRHRGTGLGGGHDEREQTLNQLLVEMDGFDDRTGIVLIAATNRPDILDPALLRPGRFDRQIVVDTPDVAGRKAILEVHARNRKLSDEVQLDVIARRTPGFTGADLENLINEGALLAARREAESISEADLEAAVDRVIAGPERKSRLLIGEEREIVAYHEAGHTLTGMLMPGADPVHKVSIVSRGQALGWTLQLPEDDRSLTRASQLRARLVVMMGGRAAEELVFGDPTTGAYDDIDKATRLARAMVCGFGMSDVIGPRHLGRSDSAPFLGREHTHETTELSDDMAALVDSEIRALLDTAHATALEMLTVHRSALDGIARGLLEHETLNSEALTDIVGDTPLWDTTGALQTHGRSQNTAEVDAPAAAIRRDAPDF